MDRDIFEIQRLAIRYAHYADTHRFDEMADLFVEDGVWDGRIVGLGLYESRDAMRTFWAGSANSVVESSAHIVANHLIEDIEGDTAKGSVYICSETRMKNGSLRFAGNLLHDVYKRTPNGWRFQSRQLTSLLTPRMEPKDAPPMRA